MPALVAQAFKLHAKAGFAPVQVVVEGLAPGFEILDKLGAPGPEILQQPAVIHPRIGEGAKRAAHQHALANEDLAHALGKGFGAVALAALRRLADSPIVCYNRG